MRIFLSALFAAFVAVSCRKDDSADTGSNTPAVTTPYLEKLVSLDTAYASGLDTVRILMFAYDANKRISKITRTVFYQGTNTVSTLNDITFIYSGSARIPAKVTNYQIEAGSQYLDTLFLYYNADNRIIRDSAVIYLSGFPVASISDHYTASGTGRYQVISKFFVPLGTIFRSDSIISSAVFAGNNMLASSDSIYTYSSGMYELSEVTQYSNTYDAKKNTLHNGAWPYPTAYSVLNLRIPELMYTISANNILTESKFNWVQGGSGITETTTRTYDYNSDGYPVTARYPGPGGIKGKDIYYYRSF